MTERATQPELLREASANDNPGPVTCLGLTFTNEAERRAYFTTRLREHLQDPTFRAIEGFPRGDDEDILALSDPPYYTACPNPFLPEIIAEWQTERAALHANLGLRDETYHREPFATDVSEGKNDPIYNAHSYHTKVPHKAIMRYILHYTEPGDIVLDGFCGTGMTGVAAQLCGDRKTVESLGYRVAMDGTIYEGDKAISRLGVRKTVLNDLSTAATFITNNYNTPIDVAAFEGKAHEILQRVQEETGWMYETWHPHFEHPERVKATINYTIWSDIYVCSNCGNEFIFWDVAVDLENSGIKDVFLCPTCMSNQSKRTSERAWEMVTDIVLGQSIRRAKQVPVSISYSAAGHRFDKVPDANDIFLIEQIENSYLPFPCPVVLLHDGYNTRQPIESHGITHVHQFYTGRNLRVLLRLWNNASSPIYKFAVSALMPRGSRMHRIAGSRVGKQKKTPGGMTIGLVTGTLYVPAISAEMNLLQQYKDRVNQISKAAYGNRFTSSRCISTGSATTIEYISDSSVDYIFIDPPFGGNLMYSELNLLWEGWLQVLTNNQPEAITNQVQGKSLQDYQRLMSQCFTEFYRILKPGQWMTIEFHNSQNAVWTAIQEAVQQARFVVADVRVLDKQQGSFKQYTSHSAVKQDLIISAYKLSTEFEEQFLSHAGSATGVWDFIRQHLVQVPSVVVNNGILETVAERQNYLLFDRMVAYYIQRGIAAPMGAAQFYAGLDQYFAEQDGMYFLPDQVAEYDKARLEYGVVAQMSLFVSDEKSAINWLRHQLQAEPMSFQQIQPRFLQELHQARHEDLPDLKILLEQSFLPDDEGVWYVPDPNRAEDLEKLRLRGLLREFAQYKESKKKLRQFRSEAVRAGFSHAWHERDYATIVEVAERLPEQVLQEDPELLMYYDNASLRAES